MRRRSLLALVVAATAGCGGGDPPPTRTVTDRPPTETATRSATRTATASPTETATATESPTASPTATPEPTPASRIVGFGTRSGGPLGVDVDVVDERLGGDSPAFLRVEVRNASEEPVELDFDRTAPGPWLTVDDDPRLALIEDDRRDADGGDPCWRLPEAPSVPTPTPSGQTFDPGQGSIFGYELWGVRPASTPADRPESAPAPGCPTVGRYRFERELIAGEPVAIELELA